jgi:hypothetical protein
MSLDMVSPQLREAYEEKQRMSIKRIPDPNYSGVGYYWQTFPSLVAGTSGYDPKASETGSNLNAVQAVPAENAIWGAQELGYGPAVGTIGGVTF